VFDGISLVYLVVNTTRWLPLDIFRLSIRKNTLRETVVLRLILILLIRVQPSL